MPHAEGAEYAEPPVWLRCGRNLTRRSQRRGEKQRLREIMGISEVFGVCGAAVSVGCPWGIRERSSHPRRAQRHAEARVRRRAQEIHHAECAEYAEPLRGINLTQRSQKPQSLGRSGTRRLWLGGRAQEMPHAECAEYAEPLRGMNLTQRPQRSQSLGWSGICGVSVGHPCHPCETIAPEAGATALRTSRTPREKSSHPRRAQRLRVLCELRVRNHRTRGGRSGSAYFANSA